MIEKLPSSHRQRAVDADEKAARRDAILDAAARLYDRAQVLPGVAEVAAEAGLAKGTMYLYFETKESIYLGLHQRHSQAFFEALIKALEGTQAFDVEAMLTVVDEHMIRHASFLPLSHVCLGAAPDRIDQRSHEAFHLTLGGWMARAGEGLERRLPKLARGDGMRFLHHGYALLLGLYQLLGQASQCAMHARMHTRMNALAAKTRSSSKQASSPVELAPPDFRAESRAALRGLWRQAELHGMHATATEATTTPQASARLRSARAAHLKPRKP